MTSWAARRQYVGILPERWSGYTLWILGAAECRMQASPGVTGPLSVTLCAHWSGHWAENQSEGPGYGRTKVLTIDQAGSQHQEWNRTQCKPSLGFSHRWTFIPELPGRAQVAPAVESRGQVARAGQGMLQAEWIGTGWKGSTRESQATVRGTHTRVKVS